jgi:hypothetical protein
MNFSARLVMDIGAGDRPAFRSIFGSPVYGKSSMVARPSSPAAVKCRILVRGGAMDYSDEIMIRSTQN